MNIHFFFKNWIWEWKKKSTNHFLFSCFVTAKNESIRIERKSYTLCIQTLYHFIHMREKKMCNFQHKFSAQIWNRHFCILTSNYLWCRLFRFIANKQTHLRTKKAVFLIRLNCKQIEENWHAIFAKQSECKQVTHTYTHTHIHTSFFVFLLLLLFTNRKQIRMLIVVKSIQISSNQLMQFFSSDRIVFK